MSEENVSLKKIQGAQRTGVSEEKDLPNEAPAAIPHWTSDPGSVTIGPGRVSAVKIIESIKAMRINVDYIVHTSSVLFSMGASLPTLQDYDLPFREEFVRRVEIYAKDDTFLLGALLLSERNQFPLSLERLRRFVTTVAIGRVMTEAFVDPLDFGKDVAP
jgi:hypothetical protein